MELNASLLRKILKTAKSSAPPAESTYRPACVFLLFFNLEDPCILAIQKADTEGYPWRNQVALPGGHVDKEDATHLDAAFRELEEELNITRNNVDFIDSLGHFQTVLNRDVEVFVGIWDGTGVIHFDSTEIARVLEIPLMQLMRTHCEKNFVKQHLSTDELLYPVDGATVWGLTARIFYYLIELFIPYLEE